jgi:hypothetical protein
MEQNNEKEDSTRSDEKKLNPDLQRPAKMYVHMLIASILFFVGAIYYDAISFVIICFVIAIIWVTTQRAIYMESKIDSYRHLRSDVLDGFCYEEC